MPRQSARLGQSKKRGSGASRDDGTFGEHGMRQSAVMAELYGRTPPSTLEVSRRRSSSRTEGHGSGQHYREQNYDSVVKVLSNTLSRTLRRKTSTAQGARNPFLMPQLDKDNTPSKEVAETKQQPTTSKTFFGAKSNNLLAFAIDSKASHDEETGDEESGRSSRSSFGDDDMLYRRSSWESMAPVSRTHSRLGDSSVPSSPEDDGLYDNANQFANSRRASIPLRVQPRPKAKRKSSAATSKPQQLPQRRPFFIWWVVILQLVIVSLTILMHPMAPINFRAKEKQSQVFTLPDGTTSSVEYAEMPNMWIGPSYQVLVRLGAKYIPCIRPDPTVSQAIKNATQQWAQQDTGCCLSATIRRRCYAATATECAEPGMTFFPNVTCGGRQCCINPDAYPGCELKPEGSQVDESCTCEVVTHPCCYGLQGECAMMTQSECLSDAVRGTYHSNANSCTQVRCMDDVCGLSGFVESGVPDQWYRFIIANFLHSGVLHFVLVAVMELMLGLELERVCGWWRMGLIFLISGVGGFAFSSLFVPYQVTLGGSGACFGMLASLIVELFQSWQTVKSPVKELIKLLIVVAFLFAVGLLPYFDNFSHFGGFICGMFASLAVLPYITFGRWDKARKRCLQIIAIPIIIAIVGVSFALLYSDTLPECSWCVQLDCQNFVAGLCSDHSQGTAPPSSF